MVLQTDTTKKATRNSRVETKQVQIRCAHQAVGAFKCVLPSKCPRVLDPVTFSYRATRLCVSLSATKWIQILYLALLHIESLRVKYYLSIQLTFLFLSWSTKEIYEKEKKKRNLPNIYSVLRNLKPDVSEFCLTLYSLLEGSSKCTGRMHSRTE